MPLARQLRRGVRRGLCLILLLAGSTAAGEYHYGTNLRCEDCHVLADVDAPADRGAVAGQPLSHSRQYALRQDGDTLCLRCHDGQTTAPDVLGDNTGSHVRQAGGLATGRPPYQRGKGHVLGDVASPPGGTSTVALHCTSCHAAHGTPYYRNLPRGTYAKAANDRTKDVFVRRWTRGDIAGNYSADAVDFNEPDPFGSAIGEFCQSCHTAFHTSLGGAFGWLRHPDAGANIGAPGHHTDLATFASRPYRVKVMSPLGRWGTQGAPWLDAPANLTPTCVSCHRAHGNQNTFALIQPATTRPISEEGGGRSPRDLCRQCHAQGG
jgi:hypothetical protein